MSGHRPPGCEAPSFTRASHMSAASRLGRRRRSGPVRSLVEAWQPAQVGGDRHDARRREKLTRRQHVVSRFYLSGFANEAGQLRRVLLPGDRAHLTNLNDASVIKDFYTVHLADGTPTDLFERLFSQVEQPASVALRAVRDGTWPLSQEKKVHLASWIALQHLRVEAVRTSQTEMQAQMIRLLVGASGKEALRAHIESAEGTPIGPERLDAEWADLTKPGGPTLRPDASEHMRTVMELLPPTAEMFASLQWSLGVYEQLTLITCDHPVVLVPHVDHPGWSGVGLATAAGFAVSLSRHLGLVIGASPDLPDLRLPGYPALGRLMNAGVAANARRCIFHHPDDTKLVEALSLPEPQLNEVSHGSTDHFVKEEGLYAGVPKGDLQAMAKATAHESGDSGVTLSDLPWPIPGRLGGP